MIYRVFIEKKNGLTVEADELPRELVEHAGPRSLKGLRIANRYDVEGPSRDEFDDVVVNDELEAAVDQLVSLLVG